MTQKSSFRLKNGTIKAGITPAFFNIIAEKRACHASPYFF